MSLHVHHSLLSVVVFHHVWEQQYAVKLRLKSTGMTMLSERGMDVGRARGAEPHDMGGEQAGPVPGQAAPRAPGAADAVREGVNILRGIFGR